MSQQRLEHPYSPDPQIVEGGNALGAPTPLPPTPSLDSRPDGIDPRVVNPEPGKIATIPEFETANRVLYVNGINSNEERSRSEALLYANAIGRSVELVHVETRGILADIETARTETINQRVAFEGLAEKAIAHEVLSLATSGKDIHIMAYSRGALVTERGLELAKKELEGRGFSADYVKNHVFNHVTLETVNGASHNVPDGVRAVHYVREGDILVGQALGMGPLAPGVRGAVIGEMAAQGDLSGIAAAARDGFSNHPNGPIIEIPPLSTVDPIAQHLFETMLPVIKPFDAVRTEYERNEHSRELEIHAREAIHPTPQPGNEPQPQLHAFQDGKDLAVDSKFSQTGTLHDYGKFVGQTSEVDGHLSVTMYSKDALFAHVPESERAGLSDAIKHHKIVTIGGHADGSLGIAAHSGPSHSVAHSPARSVDHDRGIGGRAD